MPRKPVDHFGDNPPDEAPQDEPADTSLPASYRPFDENTLKEYHAAMDSIAGRASGGKKGGSRGQAADKLLNDDVEVR